MECQRENGKKMSKSCAQGCGTDKMRWLQIEQNRQTALSLFLCSHNLFSSSSSSSLSFTAFGSTKVGKYLSEEGKSVGQRRRGRKQAENDRLTCDARKEQKVNGEWNFWEK